MITVTRFVELFDVPPHTLARVNATLAVAVHRVTCSFEVVFVFDCILFDFDCFHFDGSFVHSF